MEKNLAIIKNWLGTGAINIFGIQYSGKDTVGKKLAEVLGAEFFASGDVVRASSAKLNNKDYNDRGLLTETHEYQKLAEDFLAKYLPPNKAIILGSFGRWIGEETGVMQAAEQGGHAIRAALNLVIPEDEVWRRWRASFVLNDRGERVDENNQTKVAQRLAEFKNKTLPVIAKYGEMDLLIEINGHQSRDEVFAEVVAKLAEFAKRSRETD